MVMFEERKLLLGVVSNLVNCKSLIRLEEGYNRYDQPFTANKTAKGTNKLYFSNVYEYQIVTVQEG